MRTVTKALTVGYKDDLQWWAGVELGRRLLLIVMVIALPGKTVINMQRCMYGTISIMHMQTETCVHDSKSDVLVCSYRPYI